MYTLSHLREKHSRLAGGVSSSHDNNLVASTQLGFNKCRAVVHSRALKLGEIIDCELPVFCTRRNNNRARRHTTTFVHFNGVRLPVARKPVGSLRDHQLRSKLLRLVVSPSRKLLARNAGRKAEIVLDFRARSGLSPRSA